jgi:hypothetical protein
MSEDVIADIESDRGETEEHDEVEDPDDAAHRSFD